MSDERFILVDGKALRRLRRERALSQQDVTRLTGVAQATLSDLEGGKRGARASTLRKLAEALGVEPKELMKEKGGSGRRERTGVREGGALRSRLD
jgi:transcriptional regulator with XRE-family HTH domain